MEKTKVFLVRHGQTVANVNQILQGQTDGELTEEGREQARQVAKKMACEHIDAFISSDLLRARETCQIIAAPHHKEVVTTPLLRERDWGDLTGKYIPDVVDKPLPENVEPVEKIIERTEKFIDIIHQKYAGQTILVVGHGIVNKALQAVLFRLSMRDIEKMANAEVRTLYI